jgi:ketosteroid isomerase-like protein
MHQRALDGPTPDGLDNSSNERYVRPHTSEDAMINTIDVRTSADQILALERGALDRWGNGDPDGFLESYAGDITYFDPVTAMRIDGLQAMVNYYLPWVGKIQIARYEMLNPHVVVDGNMALLTYNLVNYIRDAHGVESVGSRWNSTTVYQHRDNTWKAIHSHWSFTRHPAFQNMTAEASERIGDLR